MTTSPDRLRPRSARMRAALTGPEWRRVGAMAAVIIALHVIGWVTLVFVVAPQHFSLGDKALGVGVGLTAYTLGMRHAFDADHIAAIDNTTRKLMNDGQRPLGVGFFFSLGHSSSHWRCSCRSESRPSSAPCRMTPQPCTTTPV